MVEGTSVCVCVCCVGGREEHGWWKVCVCVCVCDCMSLSLCR